MRRLLIAKGRANRAAYWNACLLIWVFVIASLLLVILLIRRDLVPDGIGLWVIGSTFLCAIVPFIATAVRRLHDRDKTGWWMILFFLVPAILHTVGNVSNNGQQIALNVIAAPLWAWGFIELGFARGTAGNNRFGPSPCTSGIGFIAYSTPIKTVLALCAVWLWPFSDAAPSTRNPETMTFKYYDDSDLRTHTLLDFRSIDADGPITSGTADRFAAFLKENDISDGATIYLNSPGGLVDEAIALGRQIRQAGLDSEVGTSYESSGGKPSSAGCFSACTLTFLGGVNRYVATAAKFGVHQVSTDEWLTPSEALAMGQFSIGEISKYVSDMGVKPEFVYELTRAAPEEINLLSRDQMNSLNVTTARFQTAWQIKTTPNGQFYLVGATTSNHGLHKLILLCSKSGPVLDFLFNASAENMDNVLSFATDYGFEFDDEYVDILPTELVEKHSKSGDQYVSSTIKLSPRFVTRLRTAKALTFEMTTPSHVGYWGWTTDFTKGRDQFFGLLSSCRSTVKRRLSPKPARIRQP
jgi:uncharacterized membrane protein YhaH (DUF805 family)